LRHNMLTRSSYLGEISLAENATLHAFSERQR
jgi:hypothetical protein